MPLNLDAARAVAHAAREHPGRVLFRHHDLPWQRRNLTALEDEFPPRLDGALHVTINLRSRRELQARGYAGAVTVHNYFDLDPPPGDRAATRAAFGFADDDLVVFHPARAIERKNVAGGVRYAGRLALLLDDRPVRYWLSGPAEDGYASTLERVLERSSVPVTLGRPETVAGGYAAADVVVFPSTWEGFGNPTIESIAARRPCAVFAYPVLAEILATGVRLFDTDEPEAMVRFLAQPAARTGALVRRERAPGAHVVLARRASGRHRRGAVHARMEVVVNDPVAARRARIARLADAGKRVGYLALLVAIVMFFIGLAAGFPSWTVTGTIAGLVVACVILPIPIVLGYGVRAAERDERRAS